MRLPRTCVFFFLSAFTLIRAAAETLDSVLARMDQAAKDFKSFSAGIHRVDYDAQFDSKEDKSGTVAVKRSGNGTALVGLMEFTNRQVYFFDGRNSAHYNPNTNTVERYDLSKQIASLTEELFLVGFGTRSADLSKNYSVRLVGSETVGSESATHIELTPKSQEKRDSIARIDLWIPDGKGYPIQEKFTEPNKNYWLVTYSDMKLPAAAGTSFDPKLPAGVKTIYPGRN